MNTRNTILSFVFIFTFSMGLPVNAATTQATLSIQTSSKTPTTSPTFVGQIDVEKQVRDYFKATPSMIEIARCESKFRQYTDDGTVLRGGMNNEMIGVFQFYGPVHAAGAKALGFNLATLEGNLAYAKHVYDTEGTIPWNSSRDCWETNATNTALIVATPNTEIMQQQIKLLLQLISLLQEQLATQKASQ